MTSPLTAVLGLCLVVPVLAQAAPVIQSPDLAIRIVQGRKPLPLQMRHHNVVRVRPADGPFEIVFPRGSLSVCASFDKAVYKNAWVGADALRDFRSCMVIFKAAAMPPHADYLPLSVHDSVTLKAGFDAQALSGRRVAYRVAALLPHHSGAAPIKLERVRKDLYLVMWMDKNQNRVIDKGELERWDLRFR